jgi:hypothetical protein
MSVHGCTLKQKNKKKSDLKRGPRNAQLEQNWYMMIELWHGSD